MFCYKITYLGKDREFGVTVLAGTGRVFQKMPSNSRVMGDNLRGAVYLAGNGKIRQTAPLKLFITMTLLLDSIFRKTFSVPSQSSDIKFSIFAGGRTFFHPSALEATVAFLDQSDALSFYFISLFDCSLS